MGYGFEMIPGQLKSDERLLTKDRMLQEKEYALMKPMRRIYNEIILNNPDIFFVLKRHPGGEMFAESEFWNLANEYDNAIEIYNEKPIDELIALADIIIGYSSTVCLEGWLMGKQTFMINPSRIYHGSPGFYKGNPVVDDEEAACRLIQEYYNTGSIKQFDELERERRDIIQDQIGYSDGFNYLRASTLIDKELKNNSIRRIKRDARYMLEEYIKESYRLIKNARKRMNEDKVYRDERAKETDKYRGAIRYHEKYHSELAGDIIRLYGI